MTFPFQITFDITLKDQMNFNIHHHKRLLQAIPIFLILFITNIFFIKTEGHEVFTQLLAIPLIALSLLMVISYFKTKKSYVENKTEFKNVTYIFDENYFEIKNANSQVKTKWETFKFLKENKEYLFLYPNDRMAFVVPKNKLNDLELKEIIKLLNSKLKRK